MTSQADVATDVNLNGRRFIIRPLLETDLPRLEWDGEFKHFRKLYRQHYQNSCSGSTLIFIAESETGHLAGQVFVLLYSREKSIADGIKRAYVFSFRVKPQYRKIGLGTSIMKFTEDNLLNRGYSEIRLNVAKENLEALHLYKTLGYRIIGSDPGIWNYQDHEGVWQSVREPAWQMLKLLK